MPAAVVAEVGGAMVVVVVAKSDEGEGLARFRHPMSPTCRNPLVHDSLQRGLES